MVKKRRAQVSGGSIRKDQKKRKPSFAKATEGGGGAGGGVRCAHRPLASVLQISAATYLAVNGFILSFAPHESKFSFASC